MKMFPLPLAKCMDGMRVFMYQIDKMYTASRLNRHRLFKLANYSSKAFIAKDVLRMFLQFLRISSTREYF